MVLGILPSLVGVRVRARATGLYVGAEGARMRTFCTNV